ncbi:hypothetical protein M3Y98_01221900 [Aphelenchoides besseyi]|nr:hypothetical protein M3Y98_01221900 [Aphelenchoides besseyi]
MIRIAVFAAFLCLIRVEALGTVQSAAVRGILKCNGVPAENVKVKLYDVDTLDPDDLMDEGLTDSEGRFLLRGHETEVTTIEPKLNVYNSCKKDRLLPCPKKFSIRIPGQLLCDGRPATSAVIRLFDEDFPDADDLLSEGYVDRFGYFYITGRAVEFLTINPYLSILHECDDLIVPCMKRVVVSIPSEYVSNGDLPIRIYDAGQFNLNGYFPGQDRECIY